MGRLWLALALVIALAAPAFATMPHLPGTPRINSAYLEIGPRATSTGLYDVALLRLDADLDRHAGTLRITLRTAAGEQFTVETTPDQLVLVHPNLFARIGTAHLTVTAIGTNRLESLPAQLDVVAQRDEHVRCAEMYGLAMVFGGGLAVLLMFAALFGMRATEIERTRIRGQTPPTPLPGPAAEDHIRTVALRALLAIVVVAAVVVAGIGTDMLVVPICGSPLLLGVGLTAIVRVVNAGRAIALLHGPDAHAFTRHDQLEVAACDRRVTLRSSPRLVERARSRALPRATL